ncbi:MAG: hypothetical protein ACYSYU_08915, partial [Planctomycetota bacterium]
MFGYPSAPPYSAINNIVNNVFIFRARFIYDDNEKSAWGPTSDLWPYVLHYFNTGLRSGYYYSFFKLRTQYDIPNDETLREMEVAVRLFNEGTWYIVDRVSVTSYRGSVYSYDFLNDKVLVPVPDEDANRPYDYVPLLSGSQEIIGGNDGSYLTLGDNTEGYDPLTGVTFSSTISTSAHSDGLAPLAVERHNMTTFEITTLAGLNNQNEVFIIGNGEVHRFTVDPTTWDSSFDTPVYMAATDVATYLAAQIEKLDIVASATPSSDDITIVFNGYYSDLEVLGYKHSPGSTIGSMKGGANHYFGLVYRDEFGRRGPLYADDDMKVYVPHASEANGVVERSTYVQVTVTHTPPAWAKTWELVYGETDILWYQQFLCRTHDRADKSVFLEGDVIRLKINQGQNDVRDVYDNFSYPNYVFEEGDRIRLVATRDREDGTLTKATTTTNYDNEIISFDGVYIDIPTWDPISTGSSPSIHLPDLDTTTDDLLFEVYRKKKESDDILYYGIGVDGVIGSLPSNLSVTLEDTYSVYTPLAYLRETGPYVTTETSGTTSTSTTTTFTSYESLIQMGGPAYCWNESKWQSAFVPNSNVSSKGEVHARDEDARQMRLNNIRFSGIHIDKTFVNNLNRFMFDDDVALDDKHGRLFALKEVGYTLKALQRSKSTSLYIGREMALDADGNEQLVYSDKVLGSKRPSVESFGTQDPLSVLRTNRYLYFYDQNSGAIVRDGPGGQEEISKIGMEHYFRDFIGSADRVIAGHDRIDDMVYFTLVDDDTPANNITVAFDEIRGRWISFYSFKPELYGSIGDKSFLSFVDGELWKHNDDSADRNTFYTTAYESGIELVGNENPALIKSFEAVELVGNQVWVADDNTNGYVVGIDRSLESTDLFEMLSYLRSADFVEYEGVWRAPFNKDMYTSTGAISTYDLYNGRGLRGHYITLRLKNSSTERVNLVLAKIINNI